MGEPGTERRNWDRDETILACELYWRTPYGKIHPNNPEIIELAKLIGRKPGAVSLKLSNFASCDPELKKQNKKGSSHYAKLTKEVFDEFSTDMENLTYEAQAIRARISGDNPLGVLSELDYIDYIPPGEDRERIVKARLGQYYFRSIILAAYQNRCCITGLMMPSMLSASHIKPWRESDERTERTNPRNGLCLNDLHHKAFDKGLFTIDKNYRIIISKRMRDAEMDVETMTWFMNYEGREILLPEKFLPGVDFIEYHNDEIFLG